MRSRFGFIGYWKTSPSLSRPAVKAGPWRSTRSCGHLRSLFRPTAIPGQSTGPVERLALRDLTPDDGRHADSRKFSNFLPALCIAVEVAVSSLGNQPIVRLHRPSSRHQSNDWRLTFLLTDFCNLFDEWKNCREERFLFRANIHSIVVKELF